MEQNTQVIYTTEKPPEPAKREEPSPPFASIESSVRDNSDVTSKGTIKRKRSNTRTPLTEFAMKLLDMKKNNQGPLSLDGNMTFGERAIQYRIQHLDQQTLAKRNQRKKRQRNEESADS